MKNTFDFKTFTTIFVTIFAAFGIFLGGTFFTFAADYDGDKKGDELDTAGAIDGEDFAIIVDPTDTDKVVRKPIDTLLGTSTNIEDDGTLRWEDAADLETDGSLSADVVAPAEMADADHGDFTYSAGAATLDADVVAAAEMADADHGDVSWSGGVATVEDVEFTECIYIEDPTADDDLQSIHRNSTSSAWTITEIWAESDQTVNFDLQIDDGTPADVNGTDISPAAGEAEDTSLSGDTTLGVDEELDLVVTSVANTPTWVSICWTYTN